MKENYYAFLICILKPISIEVSLQMMFDNKFNKVRNTSINKEDIKDMVKMKQQGMTYQQIGEMYGISWDAVRRRIKRYKEVNLCKTL